MYLTSFALCLLSTVCSIQGLMPSNSSRVTFCGEQTTEPISQAVMDLRDKLCIAPDVNVKPGADDNPPNVKVLESVFSESDFHALFPAAVSSYTYLNLLRSVAKFPEVCKTEEICTRTLAAMFAHFQQETSGLQFTEQEDQDEYCADWSDWLVESYPCSPGEQYFGRGAFQLTWNYNYGFFSRFVLGDEKVGLEDPDSLASTWLNFLSAVWYFVTPQPPNPSMLEVLDGSWTPNSNDLAANRRPGFGATIMIINGEEECGINPPNLEGSRARQRFYREYADRFHLDISNEKVDCVDMQAFDESGSGNPEIYWAPEMGCAACSWQTGFSALVQGDYQRCVASLGSE